MGCERGDDVVEEDSVCEAGESGHLAGDLAELLRRGAPVRAQFGDAGLDLIEQAGDADLEELIEVLAEDRQELGPLERWRRRIRRDRQHALIKLEPGQLAIDEPLRIASHPNQATGGL